MYMTSWLHISVARVSVLVQNSAVILCCLVIYVVLEYKEQIAAHGNSLLFFTYAVIIVIALTSNLVNMARTTAIERDWIVEICNGDKDMLAGNVNPGNIFMFELKY